MPELVWACTPFTSVTVLAFSSRIACGAVAVSVPPLRSRNTTCEWANTERRDPWAPQLSYESATNSYSMPLGVCCTMRTGLRAVPCPVTWSGGGVGEGVVALDGPGDGCGACGLQPASAAARHAAIRLRRST